jgi:hypothetical protein
MKKTFFAWMIVSALSVAADTLPFWGCDCAITNRASAVSVQVSEATDMEIIASPWSEVLGGLNLRTAPLGFLLFLR